MPWERPYLTEAELKECAEHFSESEDELDNEWQEDSEEIPLENALNEFDIQNLPIEFDDGFLLENEDVNEEVRDNDEEVLREETEINEGRVDPFHNNNGEKEEDKNNKRKITKVGWKKGNLILDDDSKAFKGSEKLGSTFMELETPFAFFKYFFDDQLLQKIVDESNLYLVQKDPNKTKTITTAELQKYLGICIYMSIVHMPNARSFWSPRLGFSHIKEAMSQKHFEEIRMALHFNNNLKMLPRENDNHDRLYKLRPVIDALCSKFQSVPLEQQLSVDEQLCATKARHHLKQYMPAKPHKWGYKLFVLSGVSGFSYNFEIYTGSENQPKFRLPDEPNLGASSNTVVRLCRVVPNSLNYIVYFDNYYTSLPLMSFLASKGIFSLGTVRRNRIPNCKLPSDDSMKKGDRGSSWEYVCNFDGVDVTSVAWKDNKNVLLLSTFTGELPKGTVKRFDKKQMKSVDVPCPNFVLEYNRHMGGVDLLDSLIGSYKIIMRSKKWYMRLFYHLLDMTLVNSWLLYKRVAIQKNKKKY